MIQNVVLTEDNAVLDLSKLRVIGDALVYTDHLPDCHHWLMDDDGIRYPLIADLVGLEGEVTSRLLAHYRQTTQPR